MLGCSPFDFACRTLQGLWRHAHHMLILHLRANKKHAQAQEEQAHDLADGAHDHWRHATEGKAWVLWEALALTMLRGVKQAEAPTQHLLETNKHPSAEPNVTSVKRRNAAFILYYSSSSSVAAASVSPHSPEAAAVSAAGIVTGMAMAMHASREAIVGSDCSSDASAIYLHKPSLRSPLRGDDAPDRRAKQGSPVAPVAPVDASADTRVGAFPMSPEAAAAERALKAIRMALQVADDYSEEAAKNAPLQKAGRKAVQHDALSCAAVPSRSPPQSTMHSLDAPRCLDQRPSSSEPFQADAVLFTHRDGGGGLVISAGEKAKVDVHGWMDAA